MKTWQAEILVVAGVLSTTVGCTHGGAVEWLGAAAVLAAFAHGQVSDRLAEHARKTDRFAVNASGHLGMPVRESLHHAYCWRWSLRYFVAKELLWLIYFVAHRSWSALAGVFVFLAYPLWRRWYRKVA